MCLCCECCVLSGRGLCVGLIMHPEESYQMWCVSECDHESSIMRGLDPLGLFQHGKEKNIYDLTNLCVYDVVLLVP